MNPNFFNPHNLGGDYLDLENDLRLGTPTAVFGVSEAQKALIAALRAKSRRSSPRKTRFSCTKMRCPKTRCSAE